MDLEGSPEFQALGMEMVSITADSLSEGAFVAKRFRLASPYLIDEGAKVSRQYGVMQWAHGKEPGHTFVLVGRDGKVLWVRDYGAPENGGLMYVPVEELLREITPRL